MKCGEQEVLFGVSARRRQALLTGGLPRSQGKRGSGGRLPEERLEGGVGKSGRHPGGGAGGGDRGRGRAEGGGAKRPVSSLESDGRETKQPPSASGLGSLPVLSQLAAGNSLRAGVGSPDGPRGSSGGRNFVYSANPSGIRLPVGATARPPSLRGPGPGPWRGGRGGSLLALGELRGHGGCSPASRRPRAAAARPLGKVSPGF